MRKLHLLLTIMLFSTALAAQEQGDTTIVEMDTVLLPQDYIITIADSALYAKKDTVLILPDTVEYIIQPTPSDKTKAFYETLKSQFYRTKLTKELYNLLFTDIPEEAPSSEDPEETSKSIAPYLAYEGKIIGDVKIKKVNVFGTSIDDTTRQVDSWIVSTGNHLHINSRIWVIRKNLLVKKGDVLDPFELADNERIIRELAFIQDARIKVAPRGAGSDTVDLVLITKDVWSISAAIKPKGLFEGTLNITDRNIIGLGHELHNDIIRSLDEDQIWGYEGTYRIPNTFGAFITTEFTYANYYLKHGYGAKVYRNFLTPEMKYAGGLELSRQELRRELLLSDTSLLRFPYGYDLQDLWLGRSFLIKKKDDARTQLVFSGRYTRRNFFERPVITADTNQIYHNSSSVMASIGYTTKEYYKGFYIYGFGRTEDIPEGSLAEITGGIEYGEFYKRYYGGIRLAKGIMSSRKGYLYSEANVGGFFRNGIFEQGVVNLEANMFSNLHHINNYAVRHFFGMEYTRGIRRHKEEFITINDQYGIRGLNSSWLRGTKKLALNWETLVFIPFQPIGFQFAFFGFADLGLISTAKNVFKGDFYSGFGLGLRIRNDNLTFNTFQIRLGYYPKIPADERMFDLDVSGISSFHERYFEINAPTVIEFH